MCSLSYGSTIRYSVLRVIFLLVAVWMCCALSDALAQTDFGDITVTPELHPSGDTSHGYAEYRIAISNRSPDTAHQVTLILPKASYSFSGQHIRKMTRSVVVGPSATVHVSLLQPPMFMLGNALEVVVNGEVQKEDVPLVIGQHGRNVYINYMTTGGTRRVHIRGASLSLQILISRDVDATDLHTYADKLFNSLSSSSVSPSTGTFPPPSGGRSSSPYQIIDLGFPVSKWSTSWLGFSRYDGVVVTGDDIQRMTPDVQSALWRYVECGGALFVLGGRELPESWRVAESLKAKRSADAPGLMVYDVGFGRCIVSSEINPKNLGQHHWWLVVASWLKTATPWRWEGVVEKANTMFPVVAGMGIPVRGLFFLMLLFAVVIGPVNLIVLSRKKRRIWMLWTTPVVSVVACLAVFVYATFAEGWQRRVRTEGLTILDERVHRATTIGWTAFYSALTPSDGLRFGYETELTPLAESMTTNTPRTVNWTHDQHLEKGWITARVPAHFMIRKSELRRERVTIRRGADNDLRIVNGLGADINQFWLAEVDGAMYSASNIPAGAEAVLMPLQGARVSESDEVLLFELGYPQMKKELDARRMPEILRHHIVDYGLPLSSDLEIFVEQPGRRWRVTDLRWGRSYNIEVHKNKEELSVYSDRLTNLREVFASDNWIQNIESIKTSPKKYLRPGCYIATLAVSPFIEDALRKVTKTRYSSIVYGILGGE